jgi:AcrR family transcriptional regulator
MTTADATVQPPTRERILDAAVDLFGRQGYSRTSVGEIEAAAGLTPRSGALYKHFPSKETLLRAAVARRSREVEELERIAATTMTGDPRTELPLLGRMALHAIGEDQPVLRIIMKESENFPELRDEFYDRVVRRGHGTAQEWLRLVIGRAGADPGSFDSEAMVGVMLGPIINHRVLETLFGEPYAGVDDDRFISAWTKTALGLLAAEGLLPDAQGGAKT